MPLYEYECEACSQRFERIQKFSDAPIETCPSCEGKVRKLPSSPAIQFKGSGWYITDYAKKSGGVQGGGSEKKSEGSDSSGKSDSSSEKSGDKGSDKPAASSSAKSESKGE